ncbi:MAG: accessory factor associated with RNA polymerase II [Lichina confinis]|nr:MAG: accessory factor associated with RNA polymerase II [Lichina confinis]
MNGQAMEMTEPAQSDPLLRLRQAIASDGPIIPTKSADATPTPDSGISLADATQLLFTEPTRQAFSLDTPTRFKSSDKPVDLRSIYFAWQKKDVAIPDYIASAQKLNEELSAQGAAGGNVHNLVFVERLDLITWLEGASEESEYIQPLASDSAEAAQAAGSTLSASEATGGIATISSGPAGRPGRSIDPRLAETYRLERRMGDRNTLLRGIRPTDFSHVRKSAQVFLGRNRSKQSEPVVPHPSSQTAVVQSKKAGRRPDPIILLSPSASSLLRMGNIKSFLESGLYIPPDSASTGSSNTANILHVSRVLPSIDSRPLRFILVDTPEQFKPDYWQRVVAVFTTGQTWQFKSYKWQHPTDLFRNVLGIYVGWRGDDLPNLVKGWGRGVLCTSVDKWNNNSGVQGRWRDREVVEGIWGSIEEGMRSRGWARDGP